MNLHYGRAESYNQSVPRPATGAITKIPSLDDPTLIAWRVALDFIVRTRACLADKESCVLIVANTGTMKTFALHQKPQEAGPKLLGRLRCFIASYQPPASYI